MHNVAFGSNSLFMLWICYWVFSFMASSSFCLILTSFLIDLRNKKVIFLLQKWISRIRILIIWSFWCRKSRNIFWIIKSTRLYVIGLFLSIDFKRILTLLLFIFIKVMIVNFISQRFKLQPNFTDFSQQRWLNFITAIGYSMNMAIFGFLELFIVLGFLMKLFRKRFFGWIVFAVITSPIFFVFECREDIWGAFVGLERIGNNFDADVD